MAKKIRILFLSANPWTTSRILVDEEERQIFEKLQEGPYRDRFELHKHAAIKTIDLQRLLMTYEPEIVHFSGHASKTQKIILGGTSGRGKEVDRQGLVGVFALYKNHVRLVLLNACFTKTQARSLSEVIDYTIGTGKGLGDKGGVAFAGAFYRALSFGKSVKDAFASAKAELCLTRMPRTAGIELFVRDGIPESDPFPQTGTDFNGASTVPRTLFSELFAGHSGRHDILNCAGALLHEASVSERTETAKAQIPVIETSSIDLSSKLIRHGRESHSCEHIDEHVPSMRREKTAPGLGLRARDRRSLSGLTRLQKDRRAKRVNSHPSKDESEPLSSTDYLAVTVRVQRVLMRDGNRVSLSQVARGDQTCRTRASFADKGLGCDVHCKSRRSD
jgi:hypothetical protein